MSFFADFKKFAFRGNIIELGTAVIVGGAFGKITTSFVNDVVMPPLGILLGGVNFRDLKLVLQPAQEAVKQGDVEVSAAVAEVAINYGSFLQTIVDFAIIAFAIFLVLRAFEQFKRQEEAAPAPPPAPPEPSAEQKLLAEIRDLLKQQQR